MRWIFLLLIPSFALAKVKTERITYERNGAKFEGLLAFDDGNSSPKSGVVVFHDWMGEGPFTEAQAIELAKVGYVAFAADIFGKGVRPKNIKEASDLAGKYKSDRKLLQERANAAFEYLKQRKEVNKDKMAVIGFCFGGTAALELARSGTVFQALVSFHGGLSTPHPATEFAPRILILHGADDPYVPEKEVLDFQKEMKKSKADWQFVSYGNTVHSFTQIHAGSDPSKGAAYNKSSAERAFREMRSFFEENLN